MNIAFIRSIFHKHIEVNISTESYIHLFYYQIFIFKVF